MEYQKNKNKEEPELIMSVPFSISSADTDMFARIRMGSLANLLIQSATRSADHLNVGYDSIRQQKLFWVLSRLTIEIYKPMSWYESCIVETWPKDVQKILYIRDFIVRDEKGEETAKATSGWLGIDIDTKRPRTIDSSGNPLFTRLKDRNALDISPEKLFPVKDGEVSEIKTSYYDIDLNGHVTARRYIDWMMDTFEVEFHQNNYPKIVSINYLNEIWPGEIIQITKNRQAEKTYVFEGINKIRNTIAFRGKIGF